MGMNKIVYYIIIFVLGWLIGLCVKDFKWFLYEQTFNLFECIYFVISIAIAVYVAQKIEKGNQDYRNQKDIILSKMDEVDKALLMLYESFIIKNKRYEIENIQILGQCKNIYKLADCYEKSINSYYPNLLLSNNFQTIRTRKLVRICTYVPPKGKQNDIFCKNDKWSYSEEKFVEIKNEIDNLRYLCFQNKLLLNNQ